MPTIVGGSSGTIRLYFAGLWRGKVGRDAVHLSKSHTKENTMSKRLLLVMFTLTSGLTLLPGVVLAKQQAAIQVAESSVLENTQQNARDQNDATLTPEDQKETEGDIKITASIRQAVVRNKSLSVNAQNIKIITRNGAVTLRGPVESKRESRKLKKIAKHTQGVVKVDNQLEIKAP
jgi:osmotically-inducible protein OsmY